MQLEDRFYTSTEVAEILGVSLRSVYRYLEDSKLDAEVKTATGRHRFTKKNILDFLYPKGTQTEYSQGEMPTIKKEPGKTKLAAANQDEENVDEQVKPEEIDWLSKFREAAAKFKQEQAQQPVPVNAEPEPSQPAEVYHEEPASVAAPEVYTEPEIARSPKVIEYYRSMLGGLKDIAQNIDKNSREGGLDYAFTMNAGLSLHKPIKPFAMLHVYFKHDYRDYYEKVLRLTPSDQNNAQLCVIYSNNDGVYVTKEEVHGLYVVSKPQLHRDVNEMGDATLTQELEAVFS